MLTVVIPSYNHALFIESCLRAAVECEGARIIVIDDGSTDDTVSVVESFMEQHKHHDISLIAKSNAGLISSLNMGLSATTTEYFYIVASDDIPNAEGIAQCISILDANEHIKFCIGGADAFFDNTPEQSFNVYGPTQDTFLRLPPPLRAKQALFNYPAPLLLQSTVFRTSVLKELGGWDTRLLLDDYPMFVRLLMAHPQFGLDFLYTPEVAVVKYRQHQNNSYRNIPRQYAMVSQTIQYFASGALADYATAKALAYYGLVALKNLKFGALWKMVSASSYKVCAFSLVYVVQIPLVKVLSYFKRALKK